MPRREIHIPLVVVLGSLPLLPALWPQSVLAQATGSPGLSAQGTAGQSRATGAAGFLRGGIEPEEVRSASPGRAEEPDAREQRRQRRREEALGELRRNSLDQDERRPSAGREAGVRRRAGEQEAAAAAPRPSSAAGGSLEAEAGNLQAGGARQPLDPLAAQEGETQARQGSEPAGPYDALGIRVGSFLLYPELHIERLYTDNALLSTSNPRSDQASVLTPSLTLRSNWSRHLLEGSVSGVRSYHSNFSGLDDKRLAAELHGRIDVTRRSRIDIRAGHERDKEDIDSNDAPTGAAERTPFRVNSASLEASHRFNRLTASLRGTLSKEDYDDVALISGGVANNDDRDLTERSLTGRLAYAFRPGVQGFVEASGNERDFVLALDDNGLRNGSSGYQLLAGISLAVSGKLDGEIAAGFARQKPDETSLEDVSGLILNGSLEWRATPLTTVRLEATSDVNETTSSNSAGSIERTVELSLEHQLRRNLVAGVSLGYAHERFSGSGQVDETYSLGVSGAYSLTRWLALTADYDHSREVSSVPASDYRENEFRVGVRLRR